MDEVGAVRAFNRFYTTVAGLANGMYLDMPYSLTEARALFELGQGNAASTTDLRRILDIDPGYLSRMLRRLESAGLIARSRAGDDARRQDIRLTPAGRAAAAELDARSAQQIGALLDGVDRGRLLAAMGEISSLLADRGKRPRAVVLRAPRPGDLGWVVYRHGAVYASEFGWDMDFERWVAQIIADYAADRGNERAAAWIAEVDGAPAGSVLCVPSSPDDPDTARLRVLLVERWARGLGIGGRLVDEVTRFARSAGYQRVTLSTYDALVSARRLYQAAGYTLVRSSPVRAFGQDLNAQEWVLVL